MANKYAGINDLAFLKKPKKKIISMGPDLANFVTTSKDLKRLANFGLEMMKFLPKFEQLTYAGKKGADEKEPNAKYIEYYVTKREANGRENRVLERSYVTEDYYEAFTEFSTANPAEANGLTDLDGDGGITNLDSIIKWGRDGHDGLGAWDTNWVAGQHHRVGSFGPWGSEDGSGIAGGGLGANFKNIDFIAEGSDWNHIYRRNSKEPDSTAIEDKAYFVDDMLRNAGCSWSQVTELLKDEFSGQSFYEIVMSRSYKNADGSDWLTPEQAFLLTAGLLESRERAWEAMKQLFGPVTSSRNDGEMIAAIDSFVKKQNSYMNSHELALFPLFFYMQHSFTNQVTMFYEENKGDGSVYSSLDKERFWEFSEWLGRSTYNNGGAQKDDKPWGKLYDYKNSRAEGSAEREAASRLIDRWFGATKVENERPLWEGYNDRCADGKVRKAYFAEVVEEVDPLWEALKTAEFIDSDGNIKDDRNLDLLAAAFPWLTETQKAKISQIFEGSEAISENSPRDWAPAPAGLHLNGETVIAFWRDKVVDESYGWDRKFNYWGNTRYIVAGGDNLTYNDFVQSEENPWNDQNWKNNHWRTPSNMESWINLHNSIYPDAKINSRWRGGHPNYTPSQLFGLDFNSVLRSVDYYTNWVVHAVGSYLKCGEMMDMVRVMEKCAQKREASAAFKQDTKDYMMKKDELEYEKAMNEVAAAKAAARAKAWLNSQKPKKPARNSAAAKPAGPSAEERRNFQKALQKYANRVMRNSGKRREEAMNKVREATQGSDAQKVKKHRY